MPDRRRGLVAGALGLAIVLALAAWWLASDDPLGALGLGGGGAGHAELSGLGAGGLAGDAGAGEGEARALAPDGGWGAGPPLGVWLPTATVAADPASPEGSLTGRVVSSRDGRAIAGAELVFVHDGTSTSVTTGADGRFSLRVSAAGRYVLSVVSAQGFLPYAPEWGHSAVVFEATPGRRVEGAVVHLAPLSEREVEVVRDAAPVAGATVRLHGADSGERTMAPLEATFTTGADGRVRVGGWPGAMVEATHPTHGAGRARFGWRESSEPIRVELTDERLDASGRIAGRVVDSRGAPVEGVVVVAHFQGRGLHPSGQSASDEGGDFAIEGLDAGTHVLVATHPSHPTTYVRGVATGEASARVVMERGLSASGRVLDEAGEPVPAFTVIARTARDALVRQPVGSASSYDASGRFELGGLTEGELELVATSRGFPPSAPVMITVGPHGAPPVTITLRRGGRIEGVVTSRGEPLAGATIALEGRFGAGSSAVPLFATAVSGADGSYALDGVGETHASVRVSAEGHHERILGGLLLAPGAVERVDVELTPVEEGEEPRTELAGIGVVMMPHGEALMVQRVVEGGGAALVGLARGDLVHAVDGQPVTALGFNGAIDRIRGVEGTTVVLRVSRGGQGEPADVPIVRRRVRT